MSILICVLSLLSAEIPIQSAGPASFNNYSEQYCAKWSIVPSGYGCVYIYIFFFCSSYFLTSDTNIRVVFATEIASNQILLVLSRIYFLPLLSASLFFSSVSSSNPNNRPPSSWRKKTLIGNRAFGGIVSHLYARRIGMIVSDRARRKLHWQKNIRIFVSPCFPFQISFS